MTKFFSWLRSIWAGNFGVFIREVFSDAKTKLILLLKDIAAQAVTELMTANLSSAEKREEAVKRVLEYAKSRGINAGESIVRTAVEMAYQKIKGDA